MSRLNGFLQGVKVVDLSRHLPGPLATLLLADMGAEVIKIEPPQGDELRHIGPRDEQGRSYYFDAVNAGKRTLRLDLTDPEARQRFLALVDSADILIESFRPGVMARLGLGSDSLRERNPRLIYCAMSGYGRGSPLEKSAGHDGNYLALAGVLEGTGSAETPVFFMPPVADTAGSLTGLTAILGALYARERTGEGCDIDLGLADVVMPLQVLQLAELSGAGKPPRREQALLNGGAAYYRVYATADGRHVMIGAVEPKFWRAFCEAAGKPEWIARQGEPLPQTALAAELRDYFAGLTLEQACRRFEPADCCFTPVLDLAEAVASPHVQARELVRRGADGALQALFPVRVDGQAPALRAPLVEE